MAEDLYVRYRHYFLNNGDQEYEKIYCNTGYAPGGSSILNPLDILNTKPEATLDKETFFKQEDNLRMYSDAFYGVYNDIDEFYEQQTDHFVNKDLSAQMRGTNSRQVPATGGGWSYTMLRRINTLIEYVDYCPG